MQRFLALGCVLLVACGGDDDDDDDVVNIDAAAVIDATPPIDAIGPDASTPDISETLPSPLPTGDPAVKVLSYNTALLQTIKYAPQRLPLIVEVLKTADADVICTATTSSRSTSPPTAPTASRSSASQGNSPPPSAPPCTSPRRRSTRPTRPPTS